MWLAGWEKCTYPVPVEAAVVRIAYKLSWHPTITDSKGTCHSARIKWALRKNVAGSFF